MTPIAQLPASTLETLENYRQQILAERRRLKPYALAVLCGGLVLSTITFESAGIESGITLLIVTAVGLILLGARAQRLSKRYVAAYKRDVVTAMVRQLSPDMQYDESAGIEQDVFTASRLFSSKLDRYKTSDLITGTYGKTKLRLAHIYARRESRNNDSGSSTSETTVFEGVMIIADFNKHFRARTYVRTDYAEKYIGSVGRFLQKVTHPTQNLVQLENPEFEKEFAIYADDPVEARYLLSPTLMERMLALKKRCTTDVQFSFGGSDIVIAIPNSADLFKPDVSIPATDPVQLETVYRQFRFFLSVVDDLDLNTRIWSKE